MTSLVERALQIALDAHKKQVRKTDGSPYVAHPIVVAMVLTQHGFAEEVIAAGLVHDVLEDTDIGAERLIAELGEEVVRIVRGVTEDKSLPWEERKRLYVEGIKGADAAVKAVSTADKIHNAASLIEGHRVQGAEIWKPFSKGRKQKLQFEEDLLQALRESWDHPLIDEYERLVGALRRLEF